MANVVDIENLLAQGLAYLGSLLFFAGLVQVAINSLKPLFLNPLKERLSPEVYLATFYLFRAVITGVGFHYIWGGLETVKATIPSLPSTVPDIGIVVLSIGLIILGEEVLHPIIERLYILRDAAKLLNVPLPAPVPEGTTTITTTPAVTDNSTVITTTKTVSTPEFVDDDEPVG